MSSYNPQDIERRLALIEDELAIRNLAARFTDAVNERDSLSFRQVWTEDAVWKIGPPRGSKAQGIDAIVSMFEQLLEPERLFIQLTHSGMIEITGPDSAIARFTERERGRGENDYYENLAIYRDVLVRTAAGWRFQSRVYEYRYLDTSAFAGDVFTPTVGLEPLA